MNETELLDGFQQFLAGRTPKTIRSYTTTLREFMNWSLAWSDRKRFTSNLLTPTAIEEYLTYLDRKGRAPRTRRKTLAIMSIFCRWAMGQGLLKNNPTMSVSSPVVVTGAPRELTDDQRHILKMLVEQSQSTRLQAIFTLGYWAGMRVSEVAELRFGQCNVNQRAAEITLIDAKGVKTRTLDLHNKARLALYRYLYETPDSNPNARDRASSYVFTSQRAAWLRREGRPDHLSVRGIEHLWSELKETATVKEWEQIKDIRFHDLRHDWAHRARSAGWLLEEIAVYAGHQTRDGMPAIMTTVRYTLPGRQQLKARLHDLKG